MTGQQIVFGAKGQAAVTEYDVKAPGAGEVLLKSDYSVISAGTERANLVQLPNTVTAEHGFPHYPGYSAAGRVVAVGAGVTGLEAGHRVIIPWGEHRSHTIKDERSVFRIDDDSIDILDAAFAHIASFSFLGIRKLKIELGESVVIAGIGILGAFAVQIAAASGAIPVIAIDRDSDRRALARNLGATAAYSPDDPDLIAQIKAATGGAGPNAVVEVTGAAQALQQALEYVAWEGRISLLGCTRMSDVPIDFYRYVHRRGVTLIGAHTFTRARHESAPGRWTEHDDYRTFLKLIAAEKLHARSLASEVCSLADTPEVYARLAESETMPLGIVIDWNHDANTA